MLRRLFFLLLPILAVCFWTLCSSAHAEAPLRIACGTPYSVGSFGPDPYYLITTSYYFTTADIDMQGVSNPAPEAV